MSNVKIHNIKINIWSDVLKYIPIFMMNIMIHFYINRNNMVTRGTMLLLALLVASYVTCVSKSWRRMPMITVQAERKGTHCS